MERKTLYLCDHEKNTGCKKTSCAYNPDAKYRVCQATLDIAFAKRDEQGRPILVPDLRDRLIAEEAANAER